MKSAEVAIAYPLAVWRGGESGGGMWWDAEGCLEGGRNKSGWFDPPALTK